MHTKNIFMKVSIIISFIEISTQNAHKDQVTHTLQPLFDFIKHAKEEASCMTVTIAFWTFIPVS